MLELLERRVRQDSRPGQHIACGHPAQPVVDHVLPGPVGVQ